MLRLFETSADFKLLGIHRPGVPVVVNDSDMSIHAPASLWLVYLATIPGSTRSKKTWSTYATGLVDWLRVCEANSWSWRDATEEHAAAYRDSALTQPSSFMGRALKSESINLYLTACARFYKWAVERNHASNNPFAYVKSKRPREHFLAHTDFTASGEKLLLALPVEREKRPHYYTVDERRRIQAEMAPRDRLIMRWALYSGTRISEVTTLPLDALPKQTDYVAGKWRKVWVTGKSGRRLVWVPSFILDETWQYIRFERHRIVSNCKQKARSFDENGLWLGRWGRGLTEAGVRSAFELALCKASVNGRFHDCRHTYAIVTLDRLMLQAESPQARLRNPLQALQRLLGHKHLSSTTIYLQARDEHLDDLVDDDIELPPDG
jgi:site-specific recombinase XerD